jgi:hypothetical protein
LIPLFDGPAFEIVVKRNRKKKVHRELCAPSQPANFTEARTAGEPEMGTV